jgi:hypothetical protein
MEQGPEKFTLGLVMSLKGVDAAEKQLTSGRHPDFISLPLMPS